MANVVERVSPVGLGFSITQANYDALGNAAVTAPANDPFGFKALDGYYTDAETGLASLAYCYYDSVTGRFINRDPISFAGGINLYSHARNNAVTSSDPTGLNITLCTRGVVGNCQGINHGIAHWYIIVSGQPGCGSIGLDSDGNTQLNDPTGNEGGKKPDCITVKTTPAQEACLCDTAKGAAARPSYGPCKDFNNGRCKYNFYSHNCQMLIECLFHSCGVPLPSGYVHIPGF